MKYLIIDIGGTFVKYAIMNDKADIIFKSKFKTPRDSRESLIEAIGKVFDENKDVVAISVSMPGIIDPKKGFVYMGGTLTYNNGFNIKDALIKRCNNLPVYVNNDAKCAAKAEASLGALKDVEDGVVLILGTMVGGGIILNHQVRVGKHYSCGETSYILTDKDADPSVETVLGNRCSALRLCREYAELKGIDPKDVNGEIVFDAVKNNEEEAIKALDIYTKEIAVQIFNIQTVLDPQKFAIGGGISAQIILIDFINKHLDRMYEVTPYYVPKATVVRCEFGNDANLIGALQFALE